MQSVLRTEAQEPRLQPKHYDAELSIAIFNREIQMSRLRRAKVRYFAFQPDVAVFALEICADGRDEFTDAPGRAARRLKQKAELVGRTHSWALQSVARRSGSQIPDSFEKISRFCRSSVEATLVPNLRFS